MTTSRPATLLDICEAIIDCEHKTAPTQDWGYPSIRTPNIGKGRLILDGVNRVSEETYREWTRRAVPRAGDVILAREAPVGNVAIIPLGLDLCLGQRTVLIRPNRAAVSPSYLTFLLLGNELQSRLRAPTNGATVSHLNVADIRGLPLPTLPPLPTQRKIAAILSAYDDLIENNTRRIAILEAMARALYRAWFVDFRFPGHEGVPMVASNLGTIPATWDIGRLDEALVLQRGFDLPSHQREAGGVPIYAATGVTGYHSQARVTGPGVVTGRSGSLGKVMYVGEDYWPLNTVLWSKEFRRSSPCHAQYLLSEIDLAGYNAGAAVPTLNRNDLHSRLIPLPPRSLVEAFDQFCRPLMDEKATLNEANGVLRRTRDLLLPKLVSGEVDVSGLDIAGVDDGG